MVKMISLSEPRKRLNRRGRARRHRPGAPAEPLSRAPRASPAPSFATCSTPLGLGRGPRPRAAIRGGVTLTLALLLQVALASPAEPKTTTPDMPDIASDAAPAPAGPVRHLSTVTDPDTGLVTDTYVKPLGTTTPGEVRNTRPWGEVGLLERPSPNASIVIIRVAFDIVHPDTLVPYPLDRIYNHHLVVHSRDDETDESDLRRDVAEILPSLMTNASREDLPEMLPSAAALERIPRAAVIAAMRGPLGAALRRARGHSSLLSPCGVGVGLRARPMAGKVTAAFHDPYLNGTSLWVEPPGTTWGVNAHLIDLRDVETLADAVQCNCKAYARRTPGTPQKWDHGPLPGGGIQCCGDGALAPLAPGSAALADPTAFAAPLGILYNVTWFPNTPEALANVPEAIRKLTSLAPMQTTLMVSSNPAVDGARARGIQRARAPRTRALETRGGTPLGGSPRPRRRRRAGAAEPDVRERVVVGWFVVIRRRRRPTGDRRVVPPVQASRRRRVRRPLDVRPPARGRSVRSIRQRHGSLVPDRDLRLGPQV